MASEILAAKISMEDARDLIILNSSLTEEQLRERLRPFGSEHWIEEMLSTGTCFKEAKELKFSSKGTITIWRDQPTWKPYGKGDRVTIYPDGTIKEIPRNNSFLCWWDLSDRQLLKNTYL